MNLKNLLSLFILSLGSFSSFGQTSVNWKNVQVYEFQSTEYPDSLDICGGEWFVKASASNFSQLSKKELKRIKKKVAKFGCPYVYVDIKNQFGPILKGKIYILGLKKKEEK